MKTKKIAVAGPLKDCQEVQLDINQLDEILAGLYHVQWVMVVRVQVGESGARGAWDEYLLGPGGHLSLLLTLGPAKEKKPKAEADAD